ncbi:MAG: hypothetical protein WCC48_11995 [Anaeromyxobacteraceae bacterium]
MRARTLITTSLALALAGCGGPVLFAELEMPSVAVTLPEYQFPSVVGSASQDITFDVGANVPAINEPNVDYDLKLNQMSITLRSGPFNDFDSFDTVKVTAFRAGLPDLVLVEYTNPHTTSAMKSVTATSSTGADLKPYLDAGKITVRAEFTGSPTTPVGIWYADVTADLYLRVRLDYGAYL